MSKEPLLLDALRAQQYFQRHAAKLFPDRKTSIISSVRIIMIREHRPPPSYAFVAYYDLRVRHSTKRIVALVDKKGGRLKTYQTLQRMQARFSAPHDFCFSHPYFYDRALGAAFITYIPGKTLYEVINEHQDVPSPVLNSLIRWLARLQSIPPSRIILNPRQKKPAFGYFLNDLKKARTKKRREAEKIAAIWKQWSRQFVRYWHTASPALSHGDFHTSNIKVLPRSSRVCAYDFNLMSAAPKFWDLACFLSHLETLNGRYLAFHTIQKIQRKLLSAWNKNVSALSEKDIQEIIWLKKFFDLAGITHLMAWEDSPTLSPLIKNLYARLS